VEEDKIAEKSNKVVAVLEGFINGDISTLEFERTFPIVLSEYEEVIGGSAYYPLDMLVPSFDKTVEWRESIIQGYRTEIERMEKQMLQPVERYAQTLPKVKYRELCIEGLERFPIEILDRTTKHWVESNLIKEEEISFFDGNGESLFGTCESLYKCELKHQSFLLTAVNGGFPSFPKTLEELLKQLGELSNNAPAAWIRCYDSGGHACVEQCHNFEDPFKNMGVIQWIELTDIQHTQGGVCNLLLLPESKEWMLVLSNTFVFFEITIHGNNRFVEHVVNSA